MDSKDILKDNALRETKARVEILDVLINSSKPLSYEGMKDILKVDMDKTTFYRNMATLEENSIISKFEADDKRWYFELNTKAHGHFFCRVCNNVECVYDINVSLKDYVVENVIIKGICKNCR